MLARSQRAAWAKAQRAAPLTLFQTAAASDVRHARRMREPHDVLQDLPVRRRSVERTSDSPARRGPVHSRRRRWACPCRARHILQRCDSSASIESRQRHRACAHKPPTARLKRAAHAPKAVFRSAVSYRAGTGSRRAADRLRRPVLSGQRIESSTRASVKTTAQYLAP